MAYTTISSHTGGNLWPSEWGTSGTLGIICDRDFLADDGKSWQSSDGSSLTGQFVTTAAITVTANIPTYGSFILPKTDSATPINAKYIGVIFDANGVPRDFLFSGFDLVTSLGNSITFGAWWNDNAQTRRYPYDTVPTTAQMNLAIALASASVVPATTTLKGIVKISSNPVDSANPIAVETTDPRVFQLNGSTGLASTKAIVTFGDTSVAAASRLVLRTQSTEVYALGVNSTTFSNAPLGASYKDHVGIWGYNTATNATKITAGKVNFGFANESDYYPSPTEADKQSEHYFFWTPADNSYTQRPWGFIVKHQSGEVSFETHGTQNFGRDHDQGGAIWGIWSEAGMLDLTSSAASGITFKNNANSQFRWLDSAGLATSPLYLDNSDLWRFIPNGGNVRVGAALVQLDGNLSFLNQLRGGISSNTYIQDSGSNMLDFFANDVKNFSVNSFESAFTAVPLTFPVDNTIDIGFRNFTNYRPRSIYAGTDVIIGGVYKVGANQVLGARATGWGAASGTLSRAAYAAYAGQTVSAGYVQAEAQATDTALRLVARTLAALITDITAHGMIGT